MKANDGIWEKKYYFEDLAIGEHTYLYGDGAKIRTSASTWGTRYGIWLKVNKAGKRKFKVTRLADPPKRKQSFTHEIEKRTESLEVSLKDQKDAIRTLALLVLDCKKLLEELLGDRPAPPVLVYDKFL